MRIYIYFFFHDFHVLSVPVRPVSNLWICANLTLELELVKLLQQNDTQYVMSF